MDNNNKRRFKEFEINIRFKLSALWASVTLLYLYGDYFELYVPGKLTGLINGVNILDSPVKLLVASVLLAIACLMVCIAIIAKPLLNRWLNIVCGILFSLVTFLVMLSPLTAWRSFYTGYAFLETIITIFIVWTACKWPLQSTATQ